MSETTNTVKLTETQAEVIDALSQPDTFLQHTQGSGHAVLRCIEKPSAHRWGRYERVLGGIRQATKDKLVALGLIELRKLGRYYVRAIPSEGERP